jgi:hypothetical protein
VWSTKRSGRASLALMAFLSLSVGLAQGVGWAVSPLVTVPRTDFPVTGSAPFSCIGEREAARLSRDPVHQFQAWFTRWLDDTFDIVTRLQTRDNCAPVCVTMPLDAQVITDLRGYARILPEGYFDGGGVWPSAPGDAGWDEALDVRVAGGERLVCAKLHAHSHAYDVEGYFVVYYSR